MTRTSPGRNDPCPCGSGRKYKACCLPADRKARDAGVPGVRLTPGVIERVRRETVWQAELVPFQATFADAPEARPALALVTAGGLVISGEIHRQPSGEPAEVAALLAEAVRGAVSSVGAQPSRLEARHAEVVTALGAELDGLGVAVERAERLDALDAAAAEIVGAAGGGSSRGIRPAPPRPCVSGVETWAGWALPGKVVAELFEAAAAFHDARPWRELDDEAPLSVETPGGRSWAATVLGAADFQRGLSLFSNPEDREGLLDASPWAMPEPDRFTGRALAFSFDRAEDVPGSMRREVMRAGWTVAGHDAWPQLHTINTPGGGLSEADARDLATALRAVAVAAGPLSEAWGRREPAEWTDPATGAVVRLAGRSVSGGSRVMEDPTIPRILPADSTVHRLHLELAGIEPPVWRRFEVPSDLPLWALHEVIQVVMGWEGYHLYSFEAGGVAYGEPDEDGWLDHEDAAVPLSDVARRRGAELTYLYDFGDDWVHELRVEAVEPADPGVRYPRCLAGARETPPEDCGGVFGYEELLEALEDPDSDEARELIGWVGEDFDPEAFDVDAVNELLAAQAEGPTLDPASEARFEEVLSLLERAPVDNDLPVELVNEASDLLYDYALADPDAFLAARKLEILAAGALHAAGMRLASSWSGWRPTLEDLAADWDVSTASIAQRSREIRDLVPEASWMDRLVDSARARMEQEVEELGAGDGDSLDEHLVRIAGFEAPSGPFDLEALARTTELQERDVASLRSALERGLERHRKESGFTDADLRGLPERLDDAPAFGAGLRQVLRGDETTPSARTALARWVLARLAALEPLSGDVIPTSSLLALSHLAGEGILEGSALGAALAGAVVLAPDPVDGLDAEDVRPLVRAVGADEGLMPPLRVVLLQALVEKTGWGRDGRQGPALVHLIAGEETVPASIRSDVLTLVSGLHTPASIPFAAGPATRRHALVLRAGMEERPGSFARRFLEGAFDDDVMALAAAELLEAHGADLPPDEVAQLVRQGLTHDHAPVRQAFFRAGKVLRGDAVLEWAPEDVIERGRREAERASGRSTPAGHPDQTTLF